MPAVATEGVPMAVEPVVAVSATAESANLGTDIELSSSRAGSI
jgi:hypothetical protein